jgi:hypothetical protein
MLCRWRRAYVVGRFRVVLHWVGFEVLWAAVRSSLLLVRRSVVVIGVVGCTVELGRWSGQSREGSGDRSLTLGDRPSGGKGIFTSQRG